MKIKQIKTWMMLGIVALFGSCDPGDFDDTNTNPNASATAISEAVFRNAQRSMIGVQSATTPLLYVQHLSDKQYTTSSRYEAINFDFNGWYTGPLNDLETVIQLNMDTPGATNVQPYGSNNNQIATAMIMKAFYYHFMTDRWGMLPYTEALQGNNNITPAYDTQQVIYNDLFAQLKTAVSMMDAGPGPTGDILFGGDMTSWAEFANTLRLVMATRISDIDPGTAKSEFESAAAAGVISSNVYYTTLSDEDNDNPWEDRFETRIDYNPSVELIDMMKAGGTLGLAADDGRLSQYADPALATGTYEGMPYGIAAAGTIPTSAVSFIDGNVINNKTWPYPILTKAQVHFYMAEAASPPHNWTVPGGTAQFHYEEGIRQSFSQWGASGAAAYIADPAVAWGAASVDQQVGVQKWLALYLQGYEAWAEWRRTGVPALTPAPDALNASGQIPVRHAYPTSETGANTDSYNAAVGAQGADGVDTRIWWDTF